MTAEQKEQFADTIIRLVQSFSTSEDMPIMVSTLNKRQGINGFEVAEVGHPVFEYQNRYVTYLKNAVTTVTVPYYKETLTPIIDFI